MPTSLEIQSTTTANKKQTKKINYINPDTTNSELETFSKQLTALSTNSYADATRVTEESVTEETPTPKIEPTLEVNSSGEITYNGDGALYGRITTGNGQYLFLKIYNNQLSAKSDAGSNVTTFAGEITATEGTTYAAKTTSFNIGG